MPSRTEITAAVQRAQWAGAEASSRTVAVGPLLATFDGVSTSPYRNYGVAGPEIPATAEVSALIALYRERGLLPRMELLAPSDELLARLLAGGFTVEQRLPVMALGELRPRPSRDFPARLVDTSDELRAAVAVAHEAYGEGPVTDTDVGRYRHTVAAGGWVAYAAASTGAAAGSGLATPIAHGVSTIAGVGTAVAYRRRGVASAVVTVLTEAVVAAGGLPWLETEHENETRLYGGLGYVTFGEEVVVTASS